MFTLLKPFLVRKQLLERGLRIFTPLEFSRVFEGTSHQIKHFLETQVKEGLLIRLRQGLYALSTDPPDEKEIANRLYRPSYISFTFALSFYGIIPEAVYTITSATTKPTREFNNLHIPFSYNKIKIEVFTGYSLQKQSGVGFFIADREKAFVDFVYFASLGKGPSVDRYDIRSLNKDQAVEYALMFDRKGLVEKIETLFKTPYNFGEIV